MRTNTSRSKLTDYRTRALQYVLKSLLHENYSQLRPRDDDVRQDRITKAQECKDLIRRGSQRPTGSEVLRFSSHSTNLRTANSRKDVISREHTVSAVPPHQSTSAMLSSAQLTQNSENVDGGCNYSNMVVSTASTTPAAISTTTTDLGDFWLSEDSSALPLNSNEVLMPLDEFLDVCSDPFMGAPVVELFWREQTPSDCDSTRQRAIAVPSQGFLPKDVETSTTGNLIDCSTPDMTNVSRMGLEQESPGFIDTDLNSQSILEIPESEVDVLSSHDSKDQHLAQAIPDGGSSLSALLNVEANYSNDDKKTIRTILTQFSASTGSSVSQSTASILSSQDCRARYKELVDRVDHVKCVDREDHTDYVENFEQGETDFLDYDRLNLTELRDEEGGGWFTRHLHCDNCLSRRTTDNPHAKPDPLMKYFRFYKNNDWSDKDGHTALHVAAMLGACYNTQLDIIRYGVDAHRTNFYGQTFLHVYEGSSLHDPDEGIALVRELVSRDFDFTRLDTFGYGICVPLSLGIGLYQARISPPSFCSYREDDFARFMDWIQEAQSSDKIKRVLQVGADSDCRDVFGNTLLHHSVRLGNIIATRALLSCHPNLHAINWLGNGVLAEAERALRRAKSDASLYARITACMNLAIDAGAVAQPSRDQEAAFKPGCSPSGLSEA